MQIMKEFIKKHRKTIKIIVIIYCLICLVVGGFIWRRMLIFNRGEELFAAGDYVAAKAEFAKIDEAEKMAQCDYAYTMTRLRRAEEMMLAGQLEEAKAELVILGDFENAPELLLDCEYRRALAMRDRGEYADALSLALRLDEHPEAAKLVEEIQEPMYLEALSLAYECRLDEAMGLFVKIPDYKDSEMLYKRCSDRIVHMLEGLTAPVTANKLAAIAVPGGVFYRNDVGLVYIPDVITADTTAMIFYPGGYGEALANGYMVDYVAGLYGEIPNAIMLFCYSNGYGAMEEWIERSYTMLEQAAMENNIFLHDVALIGASNGAYTAANAAVWLYENPGISAAKVVTLDAGQHWANFMPVLSGEDCDVMAKTGTEFLLIEGGNVGMNKLAIETMVAHHMDVTIAEVSNYGHYTVIYDAMRQGIFTWAMGAGELPVNDNYTYIKLDKDSTYPN